MPTVTKSVLVPHTAERMFELVDRVESYPDFLPWCAGARVIERNAQVTRARLDIDYHGLKTHFTTRNRKEPPRRMEIELEEGPFDRLDGRWTFTPLGDEGSRVELSLEYTLASRAIGQLLAPVFGQIMESLVDSFVERANVTR
jgi:ribosome-associated toxin RatA of RatAB toxin-antitoxin module